MTQERGGSLIFLAVGIYGAIVSSGFPMGQWNEPGPGVFPLVVSILLGVSGALWFVRGGKKDAGAESAGLRETLRKAATPAQIAGLTAAFILALDTLGYLLTATLYMFALFFWVSRYRLWIAALLAIAFGTGSWLFFGKLLSTPLPQGLLP